MSEANTIHKRMFERVQSHDLDGLRDLYHSDYSYLSGDGVEHNGPETGVAVSRTYLEAFPDLSFEIRATHDCGANQSIMEIIARGTHQNDLESITATGRRIELVICNVIEVRDGKILREREYYDTFTLMQQLGAIPAHA